ncbi:homeodomain transcription factor [Lithospermum erythrorhizon]|uniref:Homeobox-leucine zipper protein n=1 Tax=Lithospermum erythrorhizon TaxID=34254 RepID=A0AAV3PQM2_LITER
MDWNGHQLTRPFVPPQESSFNFLHHYNHDQFPGMEMKHEMQPPHLAIPSSITDKKKRLSTDQLDSLENSFQEEIKLDPERKMKLAKELGLQPRQIAVWFQNRRARWKAKQLEHLYNALKQEFDVVCREKNKLQEEVVALREILKGGMEKKQNSAGNTEISGGEETVESIALLTKSTTLKYQMPINTTTAAATALLELFPSCMSMVKDDNDC